MENEPSENKIQRAREYIELQKKGLNKTQSAISVGYSPKTARTPHVIEGTKAYAVALQQILDSNARSMQKLSEAIDEKIAKGDLDKMTMQQVTDIALKTAQIHKILTPQVTIKEEQMKDGTTKRTVWGQGSVQGNTTED